MSNYESDVDPLDQPFIDKVKGRTAEGFYHLKGGIESAIARGLAYAPYSDVLWFETSTPDIKDATKFAQVFPD